MRAEQHVVVIEQRAIQRQRLRFENVKARAEQMCQRLLANTVVESFRVEIA